MTNERDPLIVWLEEVRDFEGATPRAREMAQQAIDRLTPPPLDHVTEAAAAERSSTSSKVDRIVEESKAETERGRAARRQVKP